MEGCVLDGALPLSQLPSLTQLTLLRCEVLPPALTYFAKHRGPLVLEFNGCTFRFAGLGFSSGDSSPRSPTLTITHHDVGDVQLLIDLFRPQGLVLTLRAVVDSREHPRLDFSTCRTLRLSIAEPGPQADALADGLIQSTASSAVQLLDLRGSTFSTSHVSLLRNMQTLEALHLQGIRNDETHITDRTDGFPSLRSLRIYEMDGGLGNTLHGFARCTIATLLLLGLEDVDDACIAALKHWTSLRSLQLYFCHNLSADGVRGLIEHSSVSEIWLTGCDGLAPDEEASLNGVRDNCAVSILDAQ